MKISRRTLLLAGVLAAAACSPDGAGRDPLSPTRPHFTITTGALTCPDTISVGQTAPCVAYFYDQNGTLVSNAVVSWATLTPSLISVASSSTSTDSITGLAVGSGQVQATSGTVTASRNVYVKPGLTVTISPPSTVRRFDTCTWFKSVSGGTAPYTYLWDDTNGNGTDTGTTYTATVLSAGDDISLTVTDANGVKKTVVKHVTANTTAPLC